MDPLVRSRVSSFFTSAISAHVRRYSVALLLPEGGLGSGTCLRIGQRFFVATAAHVVCDVAARDIYIVHQKSRSRDWTPIDRVGARGGGRGEAIDVGYLEISASTAQTMSCDFLELSRLDLADTLPTEAHFMFGFPAELRTGIHPERELVRVIFMAYMTEKVSPEHAPAQVEDERHIALEYLEKGVIGPTDHSVEMPEPGGISGGSIWAFRLGADDRLLSAENARWVGIQHTFVRSRRIEYGSRVGDLLTLLVDDYRDIAPHVNTFAAMRFQDLLRRLTK